MEARYGFIGDGKYPNDGGEALQRLWSCSDWKEIKNCPGRYTANKDKLIRNTPPEQLLVSLMIDTGAAYHNVDGKDAICAAHFEGGGGLITYCKNDGIFVHTLNTESGFLRKMSALGLIIDS